MLESLLLTSSSPFLKEENIPDKETETDGLSVFGLISEFRNNVI